MGVLLLKHQYSPKQPSSLVLSKTVSCFEQGKPRPPENRLDLYINKHLKNICSLSNYLFRDLQGSERLGILELQVRFFF